MSSQFSLRANDQRLRANDSLPKLLQKPHIPLKEQLQIIEPVLQHGDSIYAHAKGKPGYFFGVVTVVFHKFKDVGIDHAAAENLNPSRLLAWTACVGAALAAASAYET